MLSGWQPFVGLVSVDRQTIVPAAIPAALPAGATTLTFNNIGLVIANADATPSLTQVDVSASGGDRTMRVVIGVGGSAKLCDPGLAPGSNARAC